jgi:cytochrome c-type biogenesis protein CcmF
VGVFVVGVTMVKGYEEQREATLKVGELIEMTGWRLTLRDVTEDRRPHYMPPRSRVDVERGRSSLVLMPARRVYRTQAMPMTDAAIDHGLARDLSVAPGEPVDLRAWALRVRVKSFVAWIWGGAVLMALGGGLAAADRRYRRAANVPAESPAWVRGEALA